MSRVAVTLILSLALTGAARAEWPYRTEEASNLTDGQWSMSLGVGWADRRSDARYVGADLGEPPDGGYWVVPQVHGTLGVGPRAEYSFSYEFLHYESDNGDEVFSESGDLRLWAKLGLLRRGGHTVAGRFGVKLPNSSRVGTNETDFSTTALYELRAGDWAAGANLGLAIVGNPSKNRSQDDLFTWGAALRRPPPEGRGLRLGAETAGASGPYGVKRQRTGWLAAAVAGWQFDGWRADCTLHRGFRDWQGWGWLAGVSWER